MAREDHRSLRAHRVRNVRGHKGDLRLPSDPQGIDFLLNLASIAGFIDHLVNPGLDFWTNVTSLVNDVRDSSDRDPCLKRDILNRDGQTPTLFHEQFT